MNIIQKNNFIITLSNPTPTQFPSSKRRKIEISFTGGHVTSDGGRAILLHQIDRRFGLLKQVARVLDDPRRRASCDHSGLGLLRQRVYGLALGYEDQNDHNQLRHDLALQTAVDRDRPLASQSTPNRWEHRAERSAVWEIHRMLVVFPISIAIYSLTF